MASLSAIAGQYWSVIAGQAVWGIKPLRSGCRLKSLVRFSAVTSLERLIFRGACRSRRAVLSSKSHRLPVSQLQFAKVAVVDPLASQQLSSSLMQADLYPELCRSTAKWTAPGSHRGVFVTCFVASFNGKPQASVFAGARSRLRLAVKRYLANTFNNKTSETWRCPSNQCVLSRDADFGSCQNSPDGCFTLTAPWQCAHLSQMRVHQQTGVLWGPFSRFVLPKRR